MIASLAVLLLSASPDSNLYKVKASVASPQVAVGQSTALEVQFEVAKDAHISDEAPLTIKLSGEGVSFEKPVLHYADSLKPRGPAPRFQEQLTATTPGSHTVEIDLSFYVCTAELCNRATDHRKVTLAAK